MAHRPLVSLILFGASLAAFGTTLAQTPPDASKSPAASPSATPPPAAQTSDSSPAPAQSPAPASTPNTTPTAPAATPSAPAASPTPATPPPAEAPASPSVDIVKKARLAGYRPETRNGATMYCQETANLGTRFPTKKCLDEQQIRGVLDIQRQNQDSFRQPGMCTGAGCAGH